MTDSIKAVIFDIGGVVVRSPIIAIHAYEKSLGLPHNYLNVQITSRGNQGAWQRFERGEIGNILDFYAAFGRELSDTAFGNPEYERHMKKNGSATKGSFSAPDLINARHFSLPGKIHVDGRELFGRMMREGQTYDEVVVEAIKRIRESGRLLLISVTNNFVTPYQNLLKTPSSSSFSVEEELAFLGWSNGVVPPELREMFDVFIDSSEVGMRKPEKRIYELALKMGSEKLVADGKSVLKGENVVMLDDLGINLKTASDLGMKTIHVPIGGSQQAIRQLEVVLDIPLLASSTQPALGKL